MNIRYWLVIIGALLLTSCGELREVGELNSAIRAEFDLTEGVQINNMKARMEVSFINTGLNDSSMEGKRRIAMKVGTLVPQYMKKHKVRRGAVLFVSKSSFLTLPSNIESYDMKIEEK